MKNRMLNGTLAALALFAGALMFTTPPASASMHCDAACDDGDPAQCEFAPLAFSVCIGGGAWIPCETGACG